MIKTITFNGMRIICTPDSEASQASMAGEKKRSWIRDFRRSKTLRRRAQQCAFQVET